MLNPNGDNQWNDSSSDLAYVQTQRQEAAIQNTYFRFCTDLTANLWGCLVADVVFYPLETIAIRLCVQGTRTLVDNLDNGVSVLPIVSSFDGPLDVLRNSLHSASGITGLYRGFGALILQYTIQVGFLVGVKYAYEQFLCHYSSSYIPVPPQTTQIRAERLSTPPVPLSQHQQQPSQTTFPPVVDNFRPSWPAFDSRQAWGSDSPISTLDRQNGGFGSHQSIPQIAPTTFRGYTNMYDHPL